MYGDNKGCWRPYKHGKEAEANAQIVTRVPELDPKHVRREGDNPDVGNIARRIREGRYHRTDPHPFLRKHRLRVCVSDRFHQSIRKKTHKRVECLQHLACARHP